MTDPDREFARRAGRGDRGALVGLYERYRARVFGFLVRICGRAGAEDVFQEVWVHVMEHIGSFDPRRGTFSAWIHAVAAHAAVDRLRRERVRAADSLDSPIEGRTSGGGERPASLGPSAEESALAGALGDALASALERLDPLTRAMVLLKHHLGLSYPEIANALGCPEGTVKSRVHRGVLDLRRSLEDWSDVRS